MNRFARKYLDPASRLGEILFGLIMVLTVTSSAGLTVSEGKEGVRQLLVTAIGCNIAWGIIDAVMYLMDCITVRSGRMRLVRRVQHGLDPEQALGLVRDEIEPELQELLEEQDADSLNRSVLQHVHKARLTTTRLTKEDYYGAIACFWLVLISCLPAAIPFFIFAEPRFALRVSNFLLIALLFLLGRKWGEYAGVSGLAAGLVMVAIGLVLVGMAILLGG
jgi:hypothetical protein